MHAPSAKICKNKKIVDAPHSYSQKGGYIGPLVIRVKRGGPTRIGSGPTGWKARPSKMLARALADRVVKAKT